MRDRVRPPSALISATLVLALAGCGFEGPQDLPIPGAVGGDDSYAVTVVLPDAGNLVPKETCRANDTVIGSVESVTLDDDLRARVVCRIRDDVTLPANVVATLSETSLLGERYVALEPPADRQPRGELASGSVVPVAATRVDPDVELVLGALSQVLNGGSLGEVHTISRELLAALHNTDLRLGVRRVASSVDILTEGRGRIVRAVESVDRLASRLARQRSTIARTLDVVPEGLAALDRQRPRLISLLRKVTELEEVATPLIDGIRDDLTADLRHLTPVLRGLAEQGDELALALERLATFPFPTNAMATLRGDYAGAYANAPIDIDWLNQLIAGAGTNTEISEESSGPTGPGGSAGPGGPNGLNLPQPGDLIGGLDLLDLLGNLAPFQAVFLGQGADQ